MSKKKQPEAGRAAAGGTGVKRLHFIFHVSERTNRLMKVEQVDDASGEMTEVSVDFGFTPSAATPESATEEEGFEDEEAAPYDPYGFGPQPPQSFGPFVIFWVPVALPFQPPYTMSAPPASPRKRGRRWSFDAESLRSVGDTKSGFESPHVKVAGAMDFEPEGPIVMAKPLTFKPEDEKVGSDPNDLKGAGPAEEE